MHTDLLSHQEGSVRYIDVICFILTVLLGAVIIINFAVKFHLGTIIRLSKASQQKSSATDTSPNIQELSETPVASTCDLKLERTGSPDSRSEGSI